MADLNGCPSDIPLGGRAPSDSGTIGAILVSYFWPDSPLCFHWTNQAASFFWPKVQHLQTDSSLVRPTAKFGLLAWFTSKTYRKISGLVFFILQAVAVITKLLRDEFLIIKIIF